MKAILSSLSSIPLNGLSLWFMAIFTIVFACGAIYGTGYMKHYSGRPLRNTLHWISYAVAYVSMMLLCVVENSIAFLVSWEIMALSSFFLVIYESEKPETIKAGINFFIQSHISVVLLTAGFMMIAAKTGSYSFSAIPRYCAGSNGMAAFMLLFAGFAVKAGFVPFHTWLPYAHPAAPAHISGVMSGVIIKIGIFGILRMITLFSIDFVAAGAVILAVSAISGLYGVMMAILQHNLKKLLAYHSIENIGIIGMGIGLGCIGAGNGNAALASLGFAGALLHTLNHALFKSVLFFCSGNVYHGTHTLDIERLGGLAKKMPWTAALFLTASIAICGLPPMNGFISEFLIYSGLFGWMQGAEPGVTTGAVFSILALVMIGGLAILCFTKAFGIIFLGSPRTETEAHEMEPCRIIPLAAEALIMLSIGIFPSFYARLAGSALACFPYAGSSALAMTADLGHVGFAGLILLLLAGLIYTAKSRHNTRRQVSEGPTWGCGYTEGTPRIQYTATSFVKTYVQLFSFILGTRKEQEIPTEIFPASGHFESESYDKLESNLIDKPLDAYRRFTDRFSFLQNGKMQFYVLYGIIFIVFTLIISIIFR
ncbi:MAG: hypothetical protein KBT08_07215 [Bacteroidales bacterium]|nr:hypothetical protein [Candidatus Cryptobacteroides onthequi]